jgi:iron(III) transport system ATP-binding protein
VAAVELRGLAKKYGAATAVDNVSLGIEHGKLVCLLGPSGCGKTTTLRLIAGFIEPSAGEIVVGGKVLSSPQRTVPPEGRNMSMIFQSYALWPHMTVAENVAYGLRIRKLPKAEIDTRLKAILATTRLEPYAGRYPGELSGGQQQRVSLARALVVEPETLLLDEPLSNLDANLREEMRFEIRRLHDRYRYTTVYVTHDQAEAMTTADLIAVMNHGRIEQLGTPQEIYYQPRSEFVARFIGGSNILRGKAADDSRVAIDGRLLHTTGRTLRSGEEVAVSVRQHNVRLSTSAPGAGPNDNHLQGVVMRQVFLGTSRDYTVRLGDGTELRVTAPAEQEIAPDRAVWAYLPAEHCRALMANGEGGRG